MNAIIHKLQQQYPGKAVIDLNGDGKHMVCEIEPTSDHPEYDRAIEVIIASKPHKHNYTKQIYTILTWHLDLYVDQDQIFLSPWDTHTIDPWQVHRASSEDQCIVEIHSTPWRTPDDHIPVDIDVNKS